jgi:hypothetical protein
VCLSADEHADPTGVPTGNDDWWADFFKEQYDANMTNTDGLVGRRNTWNKEGRLHFWGVPGTPSRTSSTASTTAPPG